MSDREGRADDVVSSWWEARERGEASDLEALVELHPDLADEIRLRGAALELLRGALSLEASARGATAPPGAALVGRRLGAFRLLDLLGAGGMGRVYRAEVLRPALGLCVGDRVALKVLHPHLLESEGAFQRFLLEADLGRRVAHENVVRTFGCDAFRLDGVDHHFLVMEHVEGQTLRSLLDELGVVPEDLCRAVVRDTARGLAAIHAAGALHRDVKPENLLLTRDHEVKVMDLGVARIEAAAMRLSRTGLFVGSVAYASPEQLRPKERAPDARSDLFSLGAVLYELAGGTPAFPGSDVGEVLAHVLEAKPRRLSEVNPQVSPFLEELAHALLERDPGRRPASAVEAATILAEGESSSWWHARARGIRSATRRPLRRPRVPRETALYGRDAEIDVLRALYAKAKAGGGQVALVEGEAGIGKSRLVDEFVGILEREGEDLNFLCGSFPPGGAATGTGAFSAAYLAHFGEEDLEATVRFCLPETPILVRAFAALLRGAPAPAGAEPLTKDSLQTVFVHATRALARERPTVVLVEDVHLAPEEGRALFAALARAISGHRVLLLGTSRPGLPDAWTEGLQRGVGLVRVPLTRLGPRDLSLLLVDALRSESVAEDLSFRIAAKSDGNPFFVFEILRGLREGRFLTRRPDGTWVTTGIVREITVPSTVVEVVQARLAGLDPKERELLDLASCVGFEFDPRLVADASGLPRLECLKRLARVERGHRLVRSTGAVSAFDHHLVQEVLYAGLPDALKAEYHGAVAGAIAARARAVSCDVTELGATLCADLAHHFVKGPRPVEALRYLGPAISQLARAGQVSAAMRLAAEALAVPGLLKGRERVRTLITSVQHAEGQVGYIERLEEAARLALDLDDADLRIRVAGGLSSAMTHFGRNAEALRYAEEAVALSRVGATVEARVDAMIVMANAWVSAERFEDAVACARHAEVLAEGIGARHAAGRAARVQANAWLARGEPGTALPLLERSTSLARDLGDRVQEAAALGDVGNALDDLGRYIEAQRAFESSLSLARQAGLRTIELRALSNLGACLSFLGRLRESRERAELALGMSRELGDAHGEAVGEGNLGHSALQLGLRDEAARLLESALATSRRVRRLVSVAHVLQALGRLAWEEGDRERACRLLREAIDAFRRVGAGAGLVSTLVTLGSVLADGGPDPEAVASFREALRLADGLRNAPSTVLATTKLVALREEGPSTGLAALARYGPRLCVSHLLDARFDLWRATDDVEHLADAKARLDFLVAHAPPECRESMITNVRLHREVAAAAREHLPPPSA